MKPEILLSRREFITTVSGLALTSALIPKTVDGRASGTGEFIVVNGWVLKRSETA